MHILRRMYTSTATLLSAAAGGATLHTYILSLKDNEMKLKYLAEVARTQRLQDQLHTLLDESIQDVKIVSKLGGLHAEGIELKKSADHEFELAKAALPWESLPQKTELSANIANSEANHHIGNFNNNISKMNDLSTNILELVKKFHSSGGGNGNSCSNNFSDLLLGAWHQYQEFLSTLSTEQIGALGHLWIFFFILMCLFSLISVFYGDWLIRYFKLEEKLPKLARFIQLRRKFQHYYLILNFICIILALLLLISLNFYFLLL